MDFFSSVLAFAFLIIFVVFQGFLRDYFWTPWRIHRALQRQGFRGPPAPFIVGNLLNIGQMLQEEMRTNMPGFHHDFKNRIMPHVVMWSKIYGEKLVFWQGNGRIVTTDAELVARLLSCNHLGECVKSPSTLKLLSVAFGEGVASVDGEKWYHQRRIVAPAFHVEKLKASVGIMCMCATKLVAEWNEILGKVRGGACEMELTIHMSRVTGEVLMRAQFGMDYDNLGKEIYKDISGLEELIIKSARYVWIPGSRYIPNRLNLEVWQRKRRLNKNFKRMIEKRRESGSYGNDLLGLLLSEIDSVSRDDKNLSYTIQQLMDECTTFFFAGKETTSIMLSWTILLLAFNQDWQEMARQEVITVFSNKDIDTIAAENLTKLKIIGMILNESLRLYPPVSSNSRQAIQDMRVGKDVTIPKGVTIHMDILSLHRNPKYWGADADEFRPGRFRDGIAKATGNHPCAFVPFSSGPRVCVGQNFAMMEAKVVLAKVLKSFKFEVSSSYRHAPQASFTLRPEHGIPIIVERV